MPYKNKSEQREAERRWRKRNKKIMAVRSQCRYLAKKHNLEVQTCSIENCSIRGERHHPDYSKPEEIIWLCQQHHREIHMREKIKCIVLGCNKYHYAKGMCKNHYNRNYRRLKND